MHERLSKRAHRSELNQPSISDLCRALSESRIFVVLSALGDLDSAMAASDHLLGGARKCIANAAELRKDLVRLRHVQGKEISSRLQERQHKNSFFQIFLL